MTFCGADVHRLRVPTPGQLVPAFRASGLHLFQLSFDCQACQNEAIEIVKYG